MKSSWVVVAACGMWAACSGGSIVMDEAGATFATDHPRIFLQSRRDALAAALAARQPAAMRFRALVDSWVAGKDVYNFGAWNAALLGEITGDDKYCAAAIKAIDAQVTAATGQIASGAAPDVAGDSYLKVGDMIGDLALVYDGCAGALSGERRAVWLAYADQAVYNVWNYKIAKWGSAKMPWSGWAIDDPSDNYYYSFLRATMLLGLAAHGESSRAEGWLDQFQSKLHDELVPTFNRDLVGGGSREGTGYGVAMRGLFELYDLWDSATGQRIADLTPHTRASMRSFIHQVVPTLDRIAPTGDQSRDSTAAFFDYHRNYLQELVALYPGDPVAPRAQALLAQSSLPEMGSQFMFSYDFVYANTDVAATSLDGLGTAYYAPGIGELYARSGWDTHATWINLIAGPFTQSHAHQDQGSLMIYKDGWLGYDAIVATHSGVLQTLDLHSLVRIVDSSGRNIEQQRGTSAQLVALHRGAGFLHAAADVTAVYKKSSAIQKVQREIVYLEPSTVVVYDRVTTSASGTSQIWQLVAPTRPVLTDLGAKITGAPATKDAPSHVLEISRVNAPASAAPSVFDFTGNSDFSGGFRYDETSAGGDNRSLHVLTIDGAAQVATSAADSVTLSVGTKTVTVAFRPGAIGGSITIDGQTTPLDAGLDTLPE